MQSKSAYLKYRGRQIKQYRCDKNIKIKDLAKQLKVSPNYLSEIEAGKKNLSAYLLECIWEKLNERP